MYYTDLKFHFFSLFSEVERFLVETIKKESLSKTSKEHKQTILDRIGRLREEFPQLNPEKSPEDAKTGNARGRGRGWGESKRSRSWDRSL